jgi:RNA polymerase sigma factor (sigma-70 family)
LTLPSFIKYKKLTAKEERSIMRKVAKGDKEARDFIILNNQYLVLMIANRYGSKDYMGFTLYDFVQEGNLGLIHAIDTFKVSKNVRVASYAIWWIRQKIGGAIRDRGNLISVPRYIQEDFFKLQNKLGPSPNTKITAKSIKRLAKAGYATDVCSDLSHNFTSIDSKDALKLALNNITLWDNLNNLDIERILNISKTLSGTQKYIIRHHIGLNCQSRTFQQLDKDNNLSQGGTRCRFVSAVATLKLEFPRTFEDMRNTV